MLDKRWFCGAGDFICLTGETFADVEDCIGLTG